MSDLTFVVGETAPSINGSLTDDDGAVNLTGAAVRFQMRPVNDYRFWVDAAAVVVGASAGTVRYDWAEGDLSLPGDFVSRWRIEFADDTVTYSEPENTITVEPA